MGAISKNSLVLVTGVSGLVGAHVAKDLLERGLRVRAVFRKKEQGEYFVNVPFKSFGEQFTFVVIPDTTKEGAHDEVVRDVDAIAHVASPVIFDDDGDPETVSGPAVAATLSILKSAQEYGPNIKRIVITSSSSAISQPGEGPLNQDEIIWNDGVVKAVQQLGKKALGSQKYANSKVLAERAAWDFVKQHDAKFDLVTILPFWSFGPWIHDVPSKDRLGSSAGVFLAIISSTQPHQSEVLKQQMGDYVDLRDVATLHSLALLEEKAGGERIIGRAGSFSWQKILDTLHELTPPLEWKIPRGVPGEADPVTSTLSNANALRLFGSAPYNFKFRSLAETAGDLARQIGAKGWLDA